MARNRSSEYWSTRFDILENANERDAAQAFKEVEQAQDRALADINRQIREFYRRFAINNNVTMAEARRLLNSNELKEFRWTVQDYIERGRNQHLNPEWRRQLENASARFRLSRLEALKVGIQQSVETAFATQLSVVDRHMREVFLGNYYKSAFEVQKGVGMGWEVPSIDQRKLDKVLKKPWTTDDRTFSERIWGNREKLVKELHNQLTQDIISGRPLNQSIDAIARKFNTTKGNARTLVMTESTFITTAARGEAYDELDVERFQLIATLDEKTSDICQEMDLKIFPQSERQIGVTVPPFHPSRKGCRTVDVPYFEDTTLRRWARNPDGSKEVITGNISYQEWRNKYAKESPAS